jgi:hypothetical protein
MARTRAAQQTAYDLGHTHGADPDAGGGPVPENIATDPDLLEAYDRGLRDGTDSLDAPDAGRRPHPSRRPARTAGAAKPTGKPRSAAAADADRFDAAHPRRTIDDDGGSPVGFPRPTLHLSGNNLAGFAVGLALYAVGSNFIRNGPAGVAAWFNAKFFNKVDGASPFIDNDPTGSSRPSSPASPDPKLATPAPGKVTKGTPKTGSAHLAKPGKGRPPELAP